jgi:hypothetical protein
MIPESANMSPAYPRLPFDHQGRVHHPTEYAQRCASADHAAHLKNLRTAVWVRKVRQESARGMLKIID